MNIKIEFERCSGGCWTARHGSISVNARTKREAREGCEYLIRARLNADIHDPVAIVALHTIYLLIPTIEYDGTLVFSLDPKSGDVSCISSTSHSIDETTAIYRKHVNTLLR